MVFLYDYGMSQRKKLKVCLKLMEKKIEYYYFLNYRYERMNLGLPYYNYIFENNKWYCDLCKGEVRNKQTHHKGKKHKEIETILNCYGKEYDYPLDNWITNYQYNSYIKRLSMNGL